MRLIELGHDYRGRMHRPEFAQFTSARDTMSELSEQANSAIANVSTV